MTLDLTPQQSAALQSQSGPLRLHDPATHTNYMLVREDAMASLQSLFDDSPLSASERDAILRGVWMRADWDDPAMDDYARLVQSKAAT
jgi:hypothetical protein